MNLIYDGDDCFIVADEQDNRLGWISLNRWKGQWRASTHDGQITYHYTSTVAAQAVLERGQYVKRTREDPRAVCEDSRDKSEDQTNHDAVQELEQAYRAASRGD